MLTDASWNALTDPYVLLVVLLSLVVNTLPSLTVRAFRATLGRASTQQVRAGGTAGVLLPTRLGVWDWVPQGSLDSSAGRCHLSLVVLLMGVLPDTGTNSDSRGLSQNCSIAQQRGLGQKT